MLLSSLFTSPKLSPPNLLECNLFDRSCCVKAAPTRPGPITATSCRKTFKFVRRKLLDKICSTKFAENYLFGYISSTIFCSTIFVEKFLFDDISSSIFCSTIFVRRYLYDENSTTLPICSTVFVRRY
jgi:hypothetical protein